MTSIVVVKEEDGRLSGFSEKDKRAYSRFRKSISELVCGELFHLSTWFPRNGALHRLHFGVIKALFDAQEQFDDMDDLRKWLYVGAGYADFLPGPKGKMVAIPKSIAYDRIDDADFSDLHRKVIDFMRTEHCSRFLWPHLDDAKATDTINTLLDEFERID